MVGAAPTELLLAAELAKRDIAVRIIDRRRLEMRALRDLVLSGDSRQRSGTGDAHGSNVGLLIPI